MWKPKFLTRSVLILFAFAFPLITTATTPGDKSTIHLADFDEAMPIEEAKICGGANQNCERITCLDLCLSEGEDPLDCPLYCNIFTENKFLRLENPKTTSLFSPSRASNCASHRRPF